MADEYKPKLVFTEDSPKEQYDELYKLDMGDVFKIASDYETVMRRIEEYMPENLVFKVFPINPGTDLYTMYGPDHSVVTDNRMLL
jgi:hypothetical protein